jgi:hypothetical protein
MSEIKNCPFCGSEPEYSTFGSHIQIGCCVFMSRQKSDYLTINERMTYDAETMLYSGAAEEKAFNAVAIEWNRRAPLEALADKKAVTRITEILATNEVDRLKVARISEVLKKMQIEIDAIVRGKGET